MVSMESFTAASRSQAALDAQMRKGNTNGLSRNGRRAPSSLQHRNAFTGLLLTAGLILYTASLMWPLGSFSPSWLSYPLAIAGTVVLLLSLRSMWTSSKPIGRRL